MFCVINLNFKESSEIIKELVITKKVSNEILPILLTFEEMCKNYSENKFQNSDFITNLLNYTMDNVSLDDDIKLIILFLMRKYINVKLGRRVFRTFFHLMRFYLSQS